MTPNFRVFHEPHASARLKHLEKRISAPELTFGEAQLSHEDFGHRKVVWGMY